MSAIEAIRPLVRSVRAVGSRFTCEPPPVNTDEDYLVLLDPSNCTDFYAVMRSGDWERGGSLIDDEINEVPRRRPI